MHINNLVHYSKYNEEPRDTLVETETIEILTKIGSFLSIIQNRRINYQKLMIELIRNENFCDFVLKKTEIETKYNLIYVLLKLCPHLIKIKNPKRDND